MDIKISWVIFILMLNPIIHERTVWSLLNFSFKCQKMLKKHKKKYLEGNLGIDPEFMMSFIIGVAAF